jgi:hypothetical protein
MVSRTVIHHRFFQVAKVICEQIATRYRWGLNLDFMNNRAGNSKVFSLWSYRLVFVSLYFKLHFIIHIINKNVYMLSCEKEFMWTILN